MRPSNRARRPAMRSAKSKYEESPLMNFTSVARSVA